MIEYIRVYTHIRQDTYSIIYNNRMPVFGKLWQEHPNSLGAQPITTKETQQNLNFTLNRQDNYNMTDPNNNTEPTYGIEKYSGTFEKQDGGCTIVINNTINSIRNLEVAGLYSYLVCRPTGWKLNAYQLANHFQCNKDKIYKCLSILIDTGLLTRSSLRVKGKFGAFHYRINITPASPRLEIPDAVPPDVDIHDTYKTKKVLNKEEKKKDIPASPKTGSNKVIRDYEKDERFMRFYSEYPKK